MSNAQEELAAAEYLSVGAVAAYTGLSVDFWNKLRGTSRGPIYAKLSPKVVRYRRSDIDAWMSARTRRSTFDERAVA